MTETTAAEIAAPSTELAQIGLEGATTTSTSLVLTDDTTIERAGEIGSLLGKLARASSWWVGDWVREGLRLFGDTFYGVAETESGYDHTTLKAWADTCEAIPAEERSEVLSFSTSIEMRKVAVQDMERYRELRAQLEMFKHREGRNMGHKQVREIVAKMLSDLGVQLTLGDFKTTEEELSLTRAQLDAAENELATLRLEVGLDVQCPKCGRQHRKEDAKIVPPAAEAA